MMTLMITKFHLKSMFHYVPDGPNGGGDGGCDFDGDVDPNCDDDDDDDRFKKINK